MTQNKDLRHGTMLFQRIGQSLNGEKPSTGGKPRSILEATPAEVVKRWNEREYLQRDLPSLGYRYTGLYLSLAGYYEYSTTTSNGDPKVSGIARIFLENGEIAFAAMRQKRFDPCDNVWKEDVVPLRSLFSSFYSTKTGKKLCVVYALLEADRLEKLLQPKDLPAVEILSNWTSEEPQLVVDSEEPQNKIDSGKSQADIKPYGVLEIDVGSYEQAIRSHTSSRDRFTTSFKHIFLG